MYGKAAAFEDLDLLIHKKNKGLLLTEHFETDKKAGGQLKKDPKLKSDVSQTEQELMDELGIKKPA